jgi:hypothetical protein
MAYLFYKLTLVDSLICIDKPTNRTISNNTQPLLKCDLVRLYTPPQLLHSIIYNILECSPSDSKFEDLLDSNITWLEKASAIGRDVMDSDPWIEFPHPTTEFQ